ncbi:MAG: T9SS type A sorting domain-containing protein [Bacteroidia bacterium]|nr:T9SS type A sorting domain-containing protein [Bacteroidia bacterium]
MKRTILFSLLIIGNQYLIAQDTIRDCGTEQRTDEEMEALPWYGNNQMLYEYLEQTGYYENYNINKNVQPADIRVPVKIWVHRDDDGNGGATEQDIKQFMYHINAHHINNNTGILFFIYCNIGYIDNSNYQVVTNTEAIWLATIHSEGILNVHFVDGFPDPNTNGFTYYSPRVVYVRTGAINNRSTFAHEVGHFLGLEETWRNSVEGKCKQEAVDRNRNFTWQQLACIPPKTGIICEKNGDALCDTEADFINATLNDECSVIIAPSPLPTDVWGDTYSNIAEHYRNIMSYTRPRTCRRNFSEGQISIMCMSCEDLTIGDINDLYGNTIFFDSYEPNNSMEMIQAFIMVEVDGSFIHNTSEIFFNMPQHHTFHGCMGNDDIDWVKFQITTTPLMIQIITSPGIYLNPNTNLTLFTEAGAQLAYDDDGAGNLYSEIVHEITNAGWYYVRIDKSESCSITEVLDYNITLNTCDPDLCLDGTVGSGVTLIEETMNRIDAPCTTNNYTIETGADVTFVAENIIVLHQGFYAAGKFRAYLAPVECNFDDKIQSDAISIYGLDNEALEIVFFSNIYTKSMVSTINVIPDKKELAINPTISCFPNPADDIIEFEYLVPEENSVKLSIYNLFGTEVIKIINETNHIKGVFRYRENLIDLKSGIYFYKFQCGSKIIVEKVVLQ